MHRPEGLGELGKDGGGGGEGETSAVIPQPKGSGNIGMSLASVPPSVRKHFYVCSIT